MNKPLTAILAIMTSLLSAAACAAPGEYWEVTSKMEMPGMPFAMPATTIKVCVPPGEEKDPRRMQDKKSNCEFTDVKTSGNKVSYKGKCVEKDGTMNMEGENTYERDGYHGVMHMTGKSHGRDMDMKMTSSSKRIGGSCDSEEMVKKMQAQTKDAMDKMCDTSDFDSRKWIGSATMFIAPQPTCQGKKEALCDAVRKDAPRDADTYQTLVSAEKSNGKLITKACGLDMAATTKSICKTINGKNYSQLSAHCPAEAKAFREDQRRRGCEGRSYTAATKAEDFRKCMSGVNADEASDDSMQNEVPAPHKSGNSSLNNPAADVLEGAKKLKGIFGF